MTTIPQVAAGLTKAQRAWCLDGPPMDRRGYWPARNSMARKQLISRSGELNAMGLAVREYLINEGISHG